MRGESGYADKLAGEAELWGAEAERMAQSVPPDWQHHRHLRHNVIMHAADIDAFLECVQPGMTTLELGCASGWLTLAMAERGAHATGMDISEKSLAVARHYYDSVKERIAGTVTYQAADLNTVQLPDNTYDVVAVKASLHHLVNMEHVIDAIYLALKPGGLLWAADTSGDEVLSTVLISGALCFILPTETSYRDKFAALRKFGLRAPSRVKASIQAEGLSPFEGAGREHDWVKLISSRFTVEKRVDAPAFTGYVTAQLKAPDGIALPLLKTLRAVDRLLVRMRLLRNTGVILYARKPLSHHPGDNAA
jgi:2-polyprenyl-3-methyl-5-hydroxy-6-metoxy-1,4-benzoquinol methylase